MKVRDLVLKVIYIIIGSLGIVDNLAVIIVFILFIKITDKVSDFSSDISIPSMSCFEYTPNTLQSRLL